MKETMTKATVGLNFMKHRIDAGGEIPRETKRKKGTETKRRVSVVGAVSYRGEPERRPIRCQRI